ncbi:polyhydroxyalkanoate synthesis regulator DNA-binding domain-containing protein [Aquisphaera insulae]|uniref:polyhydroxyalkanoate synthesis regulator DNA-binding domain-containing protein n=1 Tax=Aquisphaera insulae TaxID=2712864 RepID=UPI0013E9F2CE|nr:polyhydroxyalkanoate synthesis regulator DNA-binding domain-containing protein [Aquisphaera insulae]
MPPPSAEVVSIRRYPNRRLYDRHSRKYITLQDLEALVMEGKKIEVRDSRTNEDLTRAILTQILLERHPEKMEMFPVSMLHGILRANDMVIEYMRAYLRQSMTILEQMQVPQAGAPFTPFLGPMDWMRAMMPTAVPFAPPQPTEPATALTELDERIADMEDRLQRLEEPTTGRRKAPPRTPAASDRNPTIAEETDALDRLDERLSGLEGGKSKRKSRTE